MNTGTKIRTFLRIAASANTAIYAVSAAVTGLNIGWLAIFWTILTIASDLAVAFVTTYYNNDYTEVAAKHTGEMRLEKLQTKENAIITGEDFTDDYEEDTDIEEDFDSVEDIIEVEIEEELEGEE